LGNAANLSKTNLFYNNPGHEDTFTDPNGGLHECKSRLRADHMKDIKVCGQLWFQTNVTEPRGFQT